MENTTHDADVAAFIAAQPKRRATEVETLDALFRHITGFPPKLWRGAILGYGAYDYAYASGRSGTWLATGFSPRTAALSIHILPGYTDFAPILDRLGPHKKGKSCLYVTQLARIDLTVLEDLVRAGLADLNARWPVRA